uniref:Toll-like receptor 1 n=1 Tax=Branchiostoma belcheri TaxID=7741 RepID=Q1KVP8_BRABE|nr:toll-like receptor 1 [Branchiostoma belcheri]
MENPQKMHCIHSLLCLCLFVLWTKGDPVANPYDCEKWTTLDVTCTKLQLSKVPTSIPPSTLHLDLHDNSITRLQSEDFSALVNLQYLDLRWNKIEHIENTTFAPLANLKTLNVSGNKIHVSLLPQLVDFLPSLEHLEMSLNWKWDDPVTLGNMTSFNGLANLSSLNLGGNDFVDIQENSFDGLHKLQNLNLRDNLISDIKEATFCPLKELVHLDLSNNYLSGKILQLGKLWSSVVQLASLDLSENSLSSARFATAFRNFSLLHTLDLSRNELTNLTVEDFAPMFSTPLRTLQLEQNSIGHIDRGLLTSLAKLKSLKLQSNPILFSQLREKLVGLRIEELTLGGSPDLDTVGRNTFPSLPFLKKLAVSLRYEWDHPIKSSRLLEGGFSNLPNLTQLSMEGYSMSSAEPYAFTGLEYLERLELGENRLSDFPERVFHGLQSLTHLGLGYNSLTVVKSHYFNGLKNLFWLNLQNNGILFIEGTAFEDLRSLQYLILTSNHLSTVAGLQGLSNLRHLDLDRNNFTSLTAGSFSRLGSLTDMNLAHNWIRTIQKEAFSGLGILRRLNLADNRLANLTSRAFDGLSALEELKLQHNVIVAVEPYTFHGLKQMTTLNLKGHSITKIPDNAFMGLQNLTKLDLSSNQIRTFGKKAFNSLDNLRVLQLQQNEITVLDEAVFKQVLDRVTTIDLQDNPFFCDCDLLWFVFKANSQPQTVVGWYTNVFKCAAPPKSQGKSVQVLPSECERVFMPNLRLASLLSSLGIFLFMMTAFCANYYTWRFRDLWFRMRNRDRVVRVRDGEHRFVFDAFIAHHNGDKQWVERDLSRNLERSANRPNYRLCLHQRDFRAGVPIITNIRMAADSSRKIVCVITRNFLRSRWCQFEFQLAQHTMFEEGGGIRLILVFPEDIPRHLVRQYRHLQAVVDRDTYLEWPEDPRERPLFWRRLRAALGQPLEQAHDDNDSEPDQHGFMTLLEV